MFLELEACNRRIALKHLAVGEQVLEILPAKYLTLIKPTGINLAQVGMLTPTMAALKVLVEALRQTRDIKNMGKAARLQADVEETEAILAGYYEGVLEETRWELGEQRRAAAAASEATTKKSKAAKRKKQKRKA